MRIEKKCMASLWLAASLAITVQADASASPRLADGLYVIEAHHWMTDRPGGCLIVGNNGHDAVPSLYHWGGNHHRDGQCGLSKRRSVLVGNRQAVWEVYWIDSPAYGSAYVIKSHVHGRCLIQGASGHAGRPAFHMWTGIAGGSARYCGFRNATELMANGQAAWRLRLVDSFGPASQAIDYVMNHTGRDFLTFSTLPAVFPNKHGGVHAAYQYGSSPWSWHFVRMDL
jgi:hypothetical protein